MTHKITFAMKQPIIFDFPILLDGVLARGLLNKTKAKDEPIFGVSDLGLSTDANGLPCASEMFYDSERSFQQTARFRSRFKGKRAHLLKVKKYSEAIDINRGHFKSYDIPFSTVGTREVYFYAKFCDGGYGVAAELLSHVVGIGKKVGAGYGWIENFTIEAAPHVDFNAKILRPTPKRLNKQDPNALPMFRTWKAPFYDITQAELCLTPKTDPYATL